MYGVLAGLPSWMMRLCDEGMIDLMRVRTRSADEGLIRNRIALVTILGTELTNNNNRINRRK